MLCESIAICRFLAKENGLTGPDNWTAAEADMVVDSIMDMTYRGKYLGCIHLLNTRKYCNNTPKYRGNHVSFIC